VRGRGKERQVQNVAADLLFVDFFDDYEIIARVTIVGAKGIPS